MIIFAQGKSAIFAERCLAANIAIKAYVYPFYDTAFAVSKEGLDPVIRLNLTSWMEEVTQTYRPKSVSNPRVLKVSGSVFALSFDFLFFFKVPACIGFFVIGLSQISSFSFLYAFKPVSECSFHSG